MRVWPLVALAGLALLIIALDARGREAADALFVPSGRPRVAHDVTVSLWDSDRRVARLGAATITETAPHEYHMEGLRDAVFYRRYDPYVDLEALGAEYHDRRETLRFHGPLTATTRDGITARSLTALWTRRSGLLLFPREVLVETEEVRIDANTVLFVTDEDRIALAGAWEASLLGSENAPSMSGGVATYDTKEAVLRAWRHEYGDPPWDPAVEVARREVFFRTAGLAPAARGSSPVAISGDWRLSAHEISASARRGVARLSGEVSIQDGEGEEGRRLEADSAEYWWEPGYLSLEGQVRMDWKGRVATADRGFLDRDKDLLRLEGSVIVAFSGPVLEGAEPPILSAGRLEITRHPDHFAATGGFAWYEPPTTVSGQSLGYQPDEERITLEGDVLYDRGDTRILAPALRLTPSRARFVGAGRVEAGALRADAADAELDRLTGGVILRGVEGSLDGRPLSAARASRDAEDSPWRLRDASLRPGEGLAIEAGEIIADPATFSGTASRGAVLRAGKVVVSGPLISFSWQPVGAVCPADCTFSDGVWAGGGAKVQAWAADRFTVTAFSLARQGWLGADGEVTVSGASLEANNGVWALSLPILRHPEWSVVGASGAMPDDGSSLDIVGGVAVRDVEGSRTAYGERWRWDEESDEIVLDGVPRIEGDDYAMTVGTLWRKNGRWEGSGPVSWRHRGEEETSLAAVAVREEAVGYRFLGPVTMRRGDLLVEAAEARVMTEAGLILFSGAVKVVLENGSRLEGDRFTFDLDAGTGVLEGGVG
ncbi:hypothetical protein IIA16_04310, partial [bacterium]|nr:hypothetical protein [bacterium]